MTLAGALTNRNRLVIGNATLSASDEVTAAALDNSGEIRLLGSSANQALLDVSGSAGFGAAGVLSGYVVLAKDSAIEFASGQITSLSGQLNLYGNDAFIEDSTALGSNSALAGLATVTGSLYLENGASVSTTGSVTNSGYLGLDYWGGGSTLSVGGTLTNNNLMEIGNANILSSSDSVTAKSFVNSGTVHLAGNGTNLAALDVSGSTTNNGSISIAADTEELAGAVGGAGIFSLSTANLLFDSSVSAGQTIYESGADALILEQAQSFAATIRGFGDRRHDRRGELSLVRNDVEFRREYRAHGHAHPPRWEFDRQYPDDRRLFQLEFHPRPRPRDRHAGEVRLRREREPADAAGGRASPGCAPATPGPHSSRSGCSLTMRA